VPRGGGGKLAGMGLNGKPLGQDLDWGRRTPGLNFSAGGLSPA
jgi:hypothetical protein